MQKKKVLSIIFIAVMVSLLMGACRGGGNETRRWDQVTAHWSETVELENSVEGRYLDIQSATNEGFMAIKTKYPLAEECFINSNSVITSAVEGRYDNNVGDEEEPPSGTVDTPAFINALVVNEAYPGDITACQEMLAQVAEDISVWRQTRLNLYTELWDYKVKLDNQYYGDIGRALIVELLQYAGEQFMGSDAARFFKPPKVWYPTFNLEAQLGSQELCTLFEQVYPGEAYWNIASTRCELIGKAAYDVIFRPMMAAEVQEAFDTGEDTMDPLDTGE